MWDAAGEGDVCMRDVTVESSGGAQVAFHAPRRNVMQQEESRDKPAKMECWVWGLDLGRGLAQPDQSRVGTRLPLMNGL